MRKILVWVLVCIMSIGTVFGYTPSIELTSKMDLAIEKIESAIDEQWEHLREEILIRLKEYENRYQGNQKALYVIDYIYSGLDKSIVGERPNILLIIADDMWLDASPGYNEGSKKPKMLHLEQMIDNGLVYDNVWAAPVCTPTRATIMTGKYGYHTNMLEVWNSLSTSEVGIQKFVDQQTNNAYDHAVVGKWHIGNSADHPGEMWVWYYAWLLSWGVKDYSNWNMTEAWKTTTSTNYITSEITDKAISWLDERGEKPWFLWLAYTAPHSPFHLPPKDLHTQDHLSGEARDMKRNAQDYYMAMLESLDTEMWRLLDSIPEEELENTVIVFLWDNGTPGKVVQYPYKRGKSKWSLYQGGINVPMIVSGYGVDRKWEREDMLVNTTDLYATIADLAQTGTKSIYNSISFRDSFSRDILWERQYVYWESDEWYTIRDNQYKLLVISSWEEMYDLVKDPYENINLLDKTLTSVELTAKLQLESALKDLRSTDSWSNAQVGISNNHQSDNGSSHSGNNSWNISSKSGYLSDYMIDSDIYWTKTEVTLDSINRTMTTNALPNHDTWDFPGNGNPHGIEAQSRNYSFPLQPRYTWTAQSVKDPIIGINGVQFSPGTAERINCQSGEEYIVEGFQDIRNLGIDHHNAHVQPNWAYHYHGIPIGLIDYTDTDTSDLVHIGFAKDWHLVYYSKSWEYKPSYKLSTVPRKGQSCTITWPWSPSIDIDWTSPDGDLTGDWLYDKAIWDLDECNGVKINGEYMYIVTKEFPYVGRCLMWEYAEENKKRRN